MRPPDPSMTAKAINVSRSISPARSGLEQHRCGVAEPQALLHGAPSETPKRTAMAAAVLPASARRRNAARPDLPGAWSARTRVRRLQRNFIRPPRYRRSCPAGHGVDPRPVAPSAASNTASRPADRPPSDHGITRWRRPGRWSHGAGNQVLEQSVGRRSRPVSSVKAEASSWRLAHVVGREFESGQRDRRGYRGSGSCMTCSPGLRPRMWTPGWSTPFSASALARLQRSSSRSSRSAATEWCGTVGAVQGQLNQIAVVTAHGAGLPRSRRGPLIRYPPTVIRCAPIV